MTASVSPPTRTQIPGVKVKLPTTSTMPLPASPAVTIPFPPPIIGPVLHQVKFFAYAPKDNGNYVLSANTQAGSPTISVTIPGNVDEQKDLLVAKTDELDGNINTAVPLTFSHALTAIRFVCGDDMQGGTVKSVSLKNVYSKGTYNMETESWSSVKIPATFSQTFNKSTAGTAK